MPDRSSVLPSPLIAAAIASLPPAGAWVRNFAAFGPRRSKARLRARNASSVSPRRDCSLLEMQGCDTRILSARPCTQVGSACCLRFEFRSRNGSPQSLPPDRGHRTSPWRPWTLRTPLRLLQCDGDSRFRLGRPRPLHAGSGYGLLLPAALAAWPIPLG